MCGCPFRVSFYWSHGVSSLCQESKRQLNFTMFIYLLEYLQYLTFTSNISHI